MPVVPKNPFRVAQRVHGPSFAGREREVEALAAAMRTGTPLLVWGAARMGTSSLAGEAVETVKAAGGVVLWVDLETVTGLAEAADRVLGAVSEAAAWRGRLSAWAMSLAPQVVLGWAAPDRPRLSVSGASWPRSQEGEKALLRAVLKQLGAAGVEAGGGGGRDPGGGEGGDGGGGEGGGGGGGGEGGDAGAGEGGDPGGAGVVVVLDGFDRLLDVAGEGGGAGLRDGLSGGVSWVCVSSREERIRRAMEPGHAFDGFFETMRVEPLDATGLADWIDARMRGSGVASDGVGAAVVARAGPRTQDVVQVARALWHRGALRGRALASEVEAAVRDVVREQDTALRRTWSDLTPVQQRVLRAVASGAGQLFGAETRARFRLGPASSVGTAVESLVSRGVLERGDDGVVFDSPFFRSWVQTET